MAIKYFLAPEKIIVQSYMKYRHYDKIVISEFKQFPEIAYF